MIEMRGVQCVARIWVSVSTGAGLFHHWDGQTAFKEPPAEYSEMVLDWERYIDRDRYTLEFLAVKP